MAGTCALAIATLYYNQPLLPLISATFGASDYLASLIVMLGQIGYALGLMLFVPIGDRFDRRRLILSLLLANTISLAACALAPEFVYFAVATFAAGLTTITPQIIISTVAGIAAPEQRGRTVGILLCGMSAGLLFGRTVSGIVGEIAGWRCVFALAMLLNLVLVVVVWRLLPFTKPTTWLSYPHLMSSMWRLLVEQPVLRVACATGFMAFGAFSALWATLAFLLSQPPYHFGADIVGAFGLVGIIGIFAAPLVGRVTDRLGSRFMVGAGAVIVVVAFVFVWRGEGALWSLIVGMALIEIGYRAVLIGNQTRIYPLEPGAHSRLNTIFMTCVFLGGAIGSVCGATGAAYWSWAGVALAGGGLAAIGVVVHFSTAASASTTALRPSSGRDDAVAG
jgi:predicted MFS family arabinose efflux permease